MRPQIFPRPTGMMVGHDLSVNPFALCPSYAPVAKLPLAERIVELRKLDVRTRLITETPADPTMSLYKLSRMFELMFEMSDPPNYEPPMETSIASIARARGVTPEEVAYDIMLRNDGRAILYVAIANYARGNLDFVFPLAEHPSILMGNSDGGAHYGLICDASYPTFMLAYFTRDRKGRRLTVPEVVRALSKVPADFVGLKDRGVIAPGYKADINVIDYDRLQSRLPDVKYDLPGGGRRVNQDAVGYRYTLVAGEIIRQDDQPTGKLPGKLVRGGRHNGPAR
jgi:N-acyl-D-aspartate/D-glutamate deacylase